MVGSAVGHPSSPKAVPASPRIPQHLLWPLLVHGLESPMEGGNGPVSRIFTPNTVTEGVIWEAALL